MPQDMKPFYQKYNIFRRNDDGSNGDKIEGPTFTLRPHDEHARVALRAYAASVRASNAQLADDLEELAMPAGNQESQNPPLAQDRDIDGYYKLD